MIRSSTAKGWTIRASGYSNKAGYYLYAPDEQQFRRLSTCFTLEIEGLDKSLFEQ